MIKIVDGNKRSRARVRTVSQSDSVARAVQLAQDSGVGINVRHGGTVANAYKYPASTQCVGTVAMLHNGVEYVYSVATVIAANKATLAGAERATLGSRIFDGRINSTTKASEKSQLLCSVAAELGMWE